MSKNDKFGEISYEIRANFARISWRLTVKWSFTPWGDEEDEEGSDAASVKDEDEPSLAQRAPRSTHLEVTRMAAQAQPKGTPVKAKPEAKPEPEELSKKKKEKTKCPPKKKKGKQKVEEKPKHVRYAVEGEPHSTMPTGATRGEKYQAGAAYDNDVQVMQRTLESEYEVSLGRVCQHYKVCLAEETQARRELGLALLLVTDVRAYSVQMVLRCGTKNAQSTAVARELFAERYCSSSPRQVAIGLIKGVSVGTNCVGAPDWPTDFGDPAAARLPLAELKGEPLSSGYRPRRTMDQLSAFGAEDIVDMPTDALQVYCMCCVFPL